MNRIYACPVADVPEGEALRIDTSPVIALFNVGGEFYAINDRCSHGNASMSEGYIWKMTPRWSARYTPPVFA
ncbi:hypothetical protein VEE15_45240 [Escherichia coli]|nr:hypothetical protein VEE15_45240 [Escherichia coli]